MTKYKITKPIFALPPLKPKTVKVTVSPTEIDFVKQFNAICVHLNIVNNTAGAVTYTINDEGDQLSLPASTAIAVSLQNVHIEKMVVNGTDVSIIAMVADISQLQKIRALVTG